jgi:hypothetical protein
MAPKPLSNVMEILISLMQQRKRVLIFHTPAVLAHVPPVLEK